MREKLTLKTERLNELTTDELHHVAGAAADKSLSLCYPTLHGCTTAMTCP